MNLHSTKPPSRKATEVIYARIACVLQADEGVSGDVIDRPGLSDLLNFVRAASEHGPVAVLVSDPSRLANDPDALAHLCAAITDAGGQVENPAFGDGVGAIWSANPLAAAAGLEAEHDDAVFLATRKDWGDDE